MKSIAYICMFLMPCFVANAQSNQKSEESPSDLFNNFQHFTTSRPNVDSAFYCASRLASNPKYVSLLRDLLHNAFAQRFKWPDKADSLDAALLQERKADRILGQKVLARIMQDTAGLLIETVHPIILLTEVQDNNTDPATLKKLTDEFIKTEIEERDIYKNRSGRYGLMISRIIEKQPELRSVNEKLMALITADLAKNQINAADASAGSRADKRAWYRYQYAYTQYAQAEKTADIEKKKKYLKTAFEFSPDLMDNGRKSQFFYDMDFILGYENESFQDEYLTFLTKQSKDRKEVLSVLLEMALVDPEYKDELEQYYNSSSMTNSFASYWSDAINKGAKDAYPIVLNAIDKQSFSSTALAGKWILVDFWGTWCVPCREEHPDLQKLYDSTIIKNPDHISLMTIACFDQDGKVSAYMKEKSYSFPVAMSDNKIEKTYLVQGYPTKILITPAGKYITIPYNIDWVSFVRKYTGLN